MIYHPEVFTYWNQGIYLPTGQTTSNYGILDPPETIRIPPPDRDMGRLVWVPQNHKGCPIFWESRWKHPWFLKNSPLRAPGPDAYDAEVVQAGMGWDRIQIFKGGKKGRFLRKKRGGRGWEPMELKVVATNHVVKLKWYSLVWRNWSHTHLYPIMWSREIKDVRVEQGILLFSANLGNLSFPFIILAV